MEFQSIPNTLHVQQNSYIHWHPALGQRTMPVPGWKPAFARSCRRQNSKAASDPYGYSPDPHNERTDLLQKELSAVSIIWTTEHLPFMILKSHTDLSYYQIKYPSFFIRSIKQLISIVLNWKRMDRIQSVTKSSIIIHVHPSEEGSRAYKNWGYNLCKSVKYRRFKGIEVR